MTKYRVQIKILFVRIICGVEFKYSFTCQEVCVCDPAGIFRNMKRDAQGLTMAQLYNRVLPMSAKDLTWDMTTWVPHAVVINLATNDLSEGNGNFTEKHQTQFVAAYKGDCILPHRQKCQNELKVLINNFGNNSCTLTIITSIPRCIGRMLA